MYEIRQATRDDWPAIAAFIDRCYGADAPFKQRARWDWQFSDTPFAPETGDRVPVWIALDGATVAGQIALQPAMLWLEGEALPAGWIVDVMVDPAHRGKGLSHRINDAIAATGRTLVTLTMAPATRKVMEKAGCLTLPPVSQLVRPRRLSGSTIATLLDRIADNRPNLRVPLHAFTRSGIGPIAVAGALSLSAALARAAQARPAGPGCMQDCPAPEPAAIDRLSAQLVAKERGVFERGSEVFAWRFGAAPDLDYRFAQHSDDARAIVVWRAPTPVELPVGTIVDILADPDDAEAIGAAIDHAVARMAPETEALIAGASDPRFLDAFRRRGFVTVKKHWPTVVSTDRSLLSRIAGLRGTWHFSKADHDWDQIHPAQH
jgi:hypothetical protein